MSSPPKVDSPSAEFEIHSTASLVEARDHVLKHGDMFGLFNQHGDITPGGNGEQGIYLQNTRFLSKLELRLEGRRPVLLNSAVLKDNTLLTVDLTNPDLRDSTGCHVGHGCLHVFRAKLLWQGSCFEHLKIRNFSRQPLRVVLSFLFDSDYADVFEIRGLERERRGTRLPTTVRSDRLTLGYEGRDKQVRSTEITFLPEPDFVSESQADYQAEIPQKGMFDLYVKIHSQVQDGNSAPAKNSFSYQEARQKREREAKELKARTCEIRTSNQQFNDWVNRSVDDVNLLLTETAEGFYPYAGIPWFNTFFGRDGLLTGLMTLWANPGIARSVLGYLARTQSETVDPDSDAEPGKILHEAREGEMARLGEVPFRRYYGSVDSTPLFVLLAGAYHEHTGDTAFIEKIWNNVKKAISWIDDFGDGDGDGFVEYRCQSSKGLANQGWKDSFNAICHADGRAASPPIALSEVQGYVYAAKEKAAALARIMGEEDLAVELWRQASDLKKRFQVAFWCEDIQTYALALDGEKRPCRVRSSNAGQTLFTGIAEKSHAGALVETLFSPEFFSGWGIRTLGMKEAHYNPISYHNGSVWPHDNALIGLGLARYGYKQHLHLLLRSFMEATVFDSLHRLPELFCGFVRRPGEGPTPYPVACAPQAWSTAAVFCLLQAALGLKVNALEKRVLLLRPSLPPFIQRVELGNLSVGTDSIDLRLERYRQTVGVDVVKRKREWEVTAVS